MKLVEDVMTVELKRGLRWRGVVRLDLQGAFKDEERSGRERVKDMTEAFRKRVL